MPKPQIKINQYSPGQFTASVGSQIYAHGNGKTAKIALTKLLVAIDKRLALWTAAREAVAEKAGLEESKCKH